jgi:hypothetical protein
MVCTVLYLVCRVVGTGVPQSVAGRRNPAEQPAAADALQPALALRLPGAAEPQRSVPKTQGTISPAAWDLHAAFGGPLL